MQPNLPNPAHALPNTGESGARPKRPVEDVVYQAMTVAAILLVLGSLWVF